MTSLVLVWPLAAALTPVHNLNGLRWSALHVVLAFFVARGVAFDLWGWPDFQDDLTIASWLSAGLPFGLSLSIEHALLGIAGCAIWIAGVVYWRSPKTGHAPAQLAVLLWLVGMWVTGAGFGHDGIAWGLQGIGTFYLLQWFLWVDGSIGGPSTIQFSRFVLASAPNQHNDARDHAADESPVVTRQQTLECHDVEVAAPTEPLYPPDNGSPEAASQRELAALRRAAISQLAETAGCSADQDEHRQAQWAGLDDAKRWALTVRARVKQAVQDAVRPEGVAPAPPLTKNVLPALLPLTYPADFRALERWALRVGASVWLPGRPAANPSGERWSEQRIDHERPALSLPEAVEAWLRTRALLWPESWPTDDDWVLEDESPDLLLRHSDAQFAVVKNGEAAIPGRLVDVADLRWLEEILAVEGSWTARQEARGDGAGVNEGQMVQVADADRRLIARHAFRIGTKVWFDDGTESNPNGERWTQETIDARLPPLSANRGTQTTS